MSGWQSLRTLLFIVYLLSVLPEVVNAITFIESPILKCFLVGKMSLLLRIQQRIYQLLLE